MLTTYREKVAALMVSVSGIADESKRNTPRIIRVKPPFTRPPAHQSSVPVSSAVVEAVASCAVSQFAASETYKYPSTDVLSGFASG